MLKSICGLFKANPLSIVATPIFTKTINALPAINNSLTQTFTRGSKAIIERDKKRRRRFAITEAEQYATKALYMDQRFPQDWRYFLLKNFPRGVRNARSRIKNRCWLSGRSRGVYSEFGLSRIKFKEMIMNGELHGIKKASW